MENNEEPLFKKGQIKTFINDNSRRFIFTGELIDFIILRDLPKMVSKYGKSLKSYVYNL